MRWLLHIQSVPTLLTCGMHNAQVLAAWRKALLSMSACQTLLTGPLWLCSHFTLFTTCLDQVCCFLTGLRAGTADACAPTGSQAVTPPFCWPSSPCSHIQLLCASAQLQLSAGCNRHHQYNALRTAAIISRLRSTMSQQSRPFCCYNSLTKLTACHAVNLVP